MSPDNDPEPNVDGSLAQIRRSNYRSTALLVVTAAVGVALVGSGWSWPYFLWGPLVAGLAVGLTRLLLRIGSRRLAKTDEEADRARVRSWQRFRFAYLTTVIAGASFGAFAARINSALPDVAFTVLALLGPVGGFVALSRLRRRPISGAGNAERLPLDLRDVHARGLLTSADKRVWRGAAGAGASAARTPLPNATPSSGRQGRC